MVASIEAPATLPWLPQDRQTVIARAAAALEPTYDVTSGNLLPGVTRPGCQRRHVFDMTDGMRLILSMELYAGETEPRLHASASVHPGSELRLRMAQVPREFIQAAYGGAVALRIGKLLGIVSPIALECVRWDGAIIHLIGPARSVLMAAMAAGKEKLP